MLATIDDIVERLVRQYAPERIILFGSRAGGTAGEESDVDLLVLKETHDRPLERRVQVERLLHDRLLPLDIHVYTPQEMLTLFSIGDPFVEEIVEKGKVLYMRKATAAWIRETREEFDIASILLAHEKHRGVCLHSQQAVEKGLKALILEKAEKLPRTHDILELINRVRASGWRIDIDLDDIVFLNSVYRGRYPTDEGLLPHGEPTQEDAERALKVAGAILEIVDRLIPQTIGPEPLSNPETPQQEG